jgi:low molecular weight phosphotyrosine protein phosphatase
VQAQEGTTRVPRAVGSKALARALTIQHNVGTTCYARQVVASDFDKFDYILAMDDSKYVHDPSPFLPPFPILPPSSPSPILTPSLQVLKTRCPSGSRSRLALFGQFDPDLVLASPGSRVRVQAIEDPYYGGRSGFDTCFEQCTRFAKGFLDFLEGGGGDVPKY